ncbi:Fic family protein [Danxiaibacter flavus]|uniref:Fic family protein n=1 Tax=Danxiaibacter flavus TaxID=3049108 RepID=A0ABV3ZLI6_9BACT|nr:Fic family protein [Chitinophagaceae bacterium DXS]
MTKSSKRDIDLQLEEIKSAIKRFKNGASINDIQSDSQLSVGLRTLQRRLKKLQEQGYIVNSGNTRDSIYHLAEPPHPYGVKNSGSVSGEPVALSAQGKEIQKIVSNPEKLRRPVSYNFDFLRLYRPNIDTYLTEKEKQQLLETGKTARMNEPAGTYAKEILQRLLIDLSWNSSRLEGNTYSLLDTQRLVSFGEVADNKSQMEAQMILNHKEAIEFLVQDADEIGFNRYTILNLHALLSNNLLPDPSASGRLRTFGVGVAKSVYTPLAMPQQIEEMFELMLSKAGQIKDPFEQAFFIMVQLPYLQPFDDVNKRVSRLASNISLNNHNLAPLSFVDVPGDLYIQGMIGIYELNRVELFKDLFLWSYQRSALRYAALRQSLGEPDPFRLQYRDAIRAIISTIVSNVLSPKSAAGRIEQAADALPEQDRKRFVETVNAELLSLHDGNFARYGIRPSQFSAWKEAWNKSEQ